MFNFFTTSENCLGYRMDLYMILIESHMNQSYIDVFVGGVITQIFCCVFNHYDDVFCDYIVV